MATVVATVGLIVVGMVAFALAYVRHRADGAEDFAVDGGDDFIDHA